MDFSAKGTAYFVLASISTTNPIISSTKLQSLKYKLLYEDETCIIKKYLCMEHDEYQYINLIYKILVNGKIKFGRNGNVKSLFGVFTNPKSEIFLLIAATRATLSSIKLYSSPSRACCDAYR